MGDLNTNLEQVKSRQNFLQRMASLIPGYDGYVNRDTSRELDVLLRNTLASHLEANKVKLTNTVSNLSGAGKLFETSGLDKIDKKLENAIGKFKSAARGYSGAFDVVKIVEDKLSQLYAFDENLFNEVEAVSSLFTELETNSKSNIDIKDVQSRLSDKLDSLLKKFDERENLLRTI